jgi:hypothetical protein
MVQVVECPPSKHEALSSHPNTAQKNEDAICGGTHL